MSFNRFDVASLSPADAAAFPMSAQRVLKSSRISPSLWIGPDDAVALTDDEQKAYEAAHTIIRHLAVEAPRAQSSGHPGGPLSAFTFSYWVYKLRNPSIDQPYRISAGHLSVLSYGLQYLFGRDRGDERLASPAGIISSFRTPNGLPGHVEAGIGDIPFGTGPLGKGPSQALGAAFGLKLQKKPGLVDVLLADGDSQEGQVMEAFRLASHLKLGNLIVHGDFNDVQLSGVPTETVAADFAAIAAAAGWQVIEVQNGNDPAQVKAAILKANELANQDRPTFICYYTTMGHGISFMEEAANTGGKNYHGSPLSDDEAAKALAELPDLNAAISTYEPFRSTETKRFSDPVETDIPLQFAPQKYERTLMTEKGAARKELGALHLKNLMAADDRIYVLHADLAGSGGFDAVEKEFPDRVINVGVAEANMYMMAAGMRQTGLLPVTYTFAAFGINEARASARLIDINCGHTRCGVIHDCTHSGSSVGEDGETHQEQNYTNLPFYHTKVWVPADSNQAGAMAEAALDAIAEGHNSVYIFSGRSGHEQLKTPGGELLYGTDYTYTGLIDLVRGADTTDDQITILAFGGAVHDAVKAANELASRDTPVSVRVLNVSSLRPLDAGTIIKAALETKHLLTIEDHNTDGGLGTLVADVIADFSLPCSLRRLGLTQYLPSANVNDLKLIAGIDHDSIVDAVEDEIRTDIRGGEDALVSCVYEFFHNRLMSRYGSTCDQIAFLLQQDGYLDGLRSYWASSAIDNSKLPSNDALRDRIRKEHELEM